MEETKLNNDLRKVLGNEEYERHIREMELSDLEQEIKLARIRCMSPHELLSCLNESWEGEEAHIVIDQLVNVDLAPDEEKQLAGFIGKLMRIGDSLPARDKARADRTLAKLIKLLSSESACKVSGVFFEHPRKARRDIAYKVFKRIPVTKSLAKKLIQRFEKIHDEELLKIVVRSTQVIPWFDAKSILVCLNDEYWRMRVIDALLRTFPLRAFKLAKQYPCEFARAVVRAQYKGADDILQRLLQREKGNLRFLLLYARYTGIAQMKKELSVIENILKEYKRNLTVRTP